MNYTQDTQVINEIKTQLGCRDEEETNRVISRVLHVLRDQLSAEETGQIIDKLPSNLLTVYLSSWILRSTRLMTRHLDQFVNRVISYDKLKPKSMFRTEIDALRATLVVLRSLDRRFGILGYMPEKFRMEMETALISEAA